jgi:SAM-dependent methyltransferase
MAHFEQLEFVSRVKQHLPQHFRSVRVLEVGSWDVNGSIRQFFQDADYVGVDVAEGPGVDIVKQGQCVDFPSMAFDTVVTCECFEHNPFWLESFLNMSRMLKPGGLFIMTCASTGRAEHGTSRMHAGTSLTTLSGKPDYYRNLAAGDFTKRIDLRLHFSAYGFATNPFSNDLYFLGIKHVADPWQSSSEGTGDLNAILQDARSITRSTSSSAFRIMRVHLAWRVKWLLVCLLGEDGYHNVRYRIRRLVTTW